MRNAPCKRCLGSFYEKDIYTIQQFQYRKEPPYTWSLEFFSGIGVTEWDSLCKECMKTYAKESKDMWTQQIKHSIPSRIGDKR